MTSPRLLILMGCITFGLLAGSLWSFHGSASKAGDNPALPSPTQSHWNQEAGDTNDEVLRTVMARLDNVQKANQRLRQKTQHLEDTLQKESAQKDHDTQDQSAPLWPATLPPVNDAAPKEKARNAPTSHTPTPLGNVGEWVAERAMTEESPLGNVTKEGDYHASTPSPTAPMAGTHHPLPIGWDNDEDASQRNPHQTVIPRYTLPAGSTLMQVHLMTALIGEVPVSGHLLAPAFPFKAIVGKRQLLAANGWHLPPALQGMIVQGYSVGNMTLSCTRAYVTQVLFVFNDGHFVVFPKKVSHNATALYPDNSLGYVSTPSGNPCLTGKLITNAHKVIANLAALGGLAGAGHLVADQQLRTVTDGFNVEHPIAGSIGTFMGARFLGTGSDAALQWYQKRAADSFDAIYIPASLNFHGRFRPTQVVVNLTQTIPLDWNPQGRRIDERGRGKDFIGKSTLD